MKKGVFWMGNLHGMIALLALISALFAADDSIAAGKALVDSKISCDKLTNDQLEAIGDYLMELRHPGEAHEYMDKMMGGESSASLRNAHIQMAQVLYCGRSDIQLSSGAMMGMGMMGSGGGMMGGYGGMMGGAASPDGYGMMGGAAPYGSGMMGYGYPAASGWGITEILLVILLIGLILLVYVHVWKKFKENGKKKAR